MAILQTWPSVGGQPDAECHEVSTAQSSLLFFGKKCAHQCLARLKSVAIFKTWPSVGGQPYAEWLEVSTVSPSLSFFGKSVLISVWPG